MSEAALYRHFASKAQMFEGLIEFIESTVFGLINQISSNDDDGSRQLRGMVAMLLGFAERTPGDAGADRRRAGDGRRPPQERINQLIDRIEASIKQLPQAIAQGRLPPDTDPVARAGIVLAFILGRWLRYAKSGFRRMPTEHFDTPDRRSSAELPTRPRSARGAPHALSFRLDTTRGSDIRACGSFGRRDTHER
jgi:TetR/AcrR family transcriptional regulator